MFIYKITYLGGSSVQIRANSPKQAYELGTKPGLEVIFVKFIR